MIKVSICCITYNHEKYISNALEGFLAQKVNYTYEIIVADDASSDRTGDIIEAFQKNCPVQMKYHRQEKNVGMLANFSYAMNACSGQYIALCEGDDYWIDSFKLQKQINFLDSNPDYSICYHRVYELFDDGKKIIDTLNSNESEFTYTIRDLSKKNFIHTPSLVYRNRLFKEFPRWFLESPVGDYVLNMLNARHGKIKYFPELMAVYRKHNSGAWSTQSKLKLQERWLKVLSYLMKEDFGNEVINELSSQKHTVANQYLHNILNVNPDIFADTLRTFIAEDPSLVEEWLYKFYPEHLQQIKSSNTYRLAQKLSNLKSKLSGKSN